MLHAAVAGAWLTGLLHHDGPAEAGASPATVELVMTPPGSQADAPDRTTAEHVQDIVQNDAPARDSQASPSTSSATNAQPPGLGPDASAGATAADGPTAIAPTEIAPGDGQAQAMLPPPMPPPRAASAQRAAAAPAAAAPTPPADKPDPPATPPSQAAPQFSLGGIASDTNALVTGDLIVPAGVDPRFHNRKPSYPDEAARRGQQGAVMLLVHVSAQGLVSRVDVAQSSGFRLLDQAAREAVQSWRFLPAVKDGQPIPSEMPLRIEFNLY